MAVQQQKSKVSGLCHQHHQRGRHVFLYDGHWRLRRKPWRGLWCVQGGALPHLPLRVRAAAAVKQSPAAVKTDRGTFHIYKYYF